MQRGGNGYYVHHGQADDGQRYCYALPDGGNCPIPPRAGSPTAYISRRPFIRPAYSSGAMWRGEAFRAETW